MNKSSRSLAFLPWSVAVAVAVSCSGSGPSPTSPVLPPPTTSGAPGATPLASPTPTPFPSASPIPPAPSSPAAATCRYGMGTVSTSCARGASAFVSEVDSAIEQLAREQPALFNLGDQAGPGGYRVLDTEKYYAGVIRILQGRDYCAGFDLVELQIKNSSDFSEQFDILTSDGHVRKGAGAYRATCSPPNFPLDPEDLIDHVRVGFFGFRCDDGVTPPRNAEGKLPLGCVGNVTATPKRRDGRDVDSRIHGDRIDWRFVNEEQAVRLSDFPGIAFNKQIDALQPGHFTLCATVKGVEGCMHGEVPRVWPIPE
jgi:hypothetical protein